MERDVRGRYMSDSQFYPWHWKESIEASDGYDTALWATSLSGANGLLGTFDVGLWHVDPARDRPQRRPTTEGDVHRRHGALGAGL